MENRAMPPADTEKAIARTAAAAERARWNSLWRITLAGFLAGFVLGGLFGSQAILSEGWAVGVRFIAGAGLAGGIAGALLVSPAAILRAALLRRRLIREGGFTPSQIRQALKSGGRE
jgi:hypothetical protein